MALSVLVTLVLGTVAPPLPCGPVPDPRQRDRLGLETCALVHLGLPTFLDRDAARPDDDRSRFWIADFDAASWFDDLRTMGLDGLVLVVRDTDGLSLADTDILPSVRRAATAASMPLGLSVAGRGSDRQVAEELADLCGRFGPLFEVRIGSDVSGTLADSDGVECRDACVVSADGPDFVSARLGATITQADGRWQGVERVISIRPSWYWRGGEDETLRGLRELEDAWFASVGIGEPLLIGIPADRAGRLRPGDVRRIAELRRRISTIFDRDLAREATAAASEVRGGDPAYGPERAIDGNDADFWATDDGTAEASIELAWAATQTLDTVEMREPATLGRRCTAWALDARTGGTWHEIARGDSIGYRRIERFPTTETDAIRLRIRSDGCGPALARLALFATPPDVRLAAGEISFSKRTDASLASDRPEATIRFTLDGRDPIEHGSTASGPIAIESSCLLRAIAIDARGRAGHPLTVRFMRVDDATFEESVAGPERPMPGLALEWHDAVDESLDELIGRVPRSLSTVDDVRLPAERPRDGFALVFRGFLRIPVDGLYTFALKSDDGSRLYLGDRLVVDRDGEQNYDVREGRIALRRGLHPIRVEFCEFAGRESLTLSWGLPGEPLAKIPADAFVR